MSATFVGWLQIVLVLALVVGLAHPLGSFIVELFEGRRTFLSPVVGPVERGIYRLAGIDPAIEQEWLPYTLCMLIFVAGCFVLLYALLRLQNLLPLNPQGFDAVPPDLAFNTAISFITNANWQAYGGETTMSHLTQMLGLTANNFLDSAVATALVIAVIRGIARGGSKTIGNFWVDLTRATLYLYLPLSVVVALAFVALGVPQTLQGSVEATTLEGAKQVISLGPVASQEAIKLIGTNGGGFFNANSAHPFENPNVWSNMLQAWSMLVVPVALVFAFGRLVGDPRQGRALLYTMGIFFLLGLAVLYYAEAAGNPILTALGVDPSLGNLEGKDLRFGQAHASLFAAATTGTGTGAANATYDSMTPLGGAVPLFFLLIGCITPGGVGTGLYDMLLISIIAIFIAGLMVGRTPEYLGNKIEVREMKLVMYAFLVAPFFILGFGMIAAIAKFALDSLGNSGPHGLTEIIYAYAATASDNGSAFGGLTANTPWFNTSTGLAMLAGRLMHAVPVMALAGSLALKTRAAPSMGTFPTHGPLFVGLLVGVIIIVGLLTYFPALALGPIIEHLLMLGGKTF
ncbi:MAG: potassium-transporting ATPase subunit KdpA [Roseiarcus sp.]|jgi:K+-transporting ATPase ATPase A chain